MALKGVNLIEQHFEKAIAGVFAIGLLGVVAWQFLSPPSVVKVGSAEVPIADAYSKVAEEAKRTQNKLDAINVEKPTGVDPAAASLAQFEKTFRGPVASSPQLVASLDRAPAPLGGSGVAGGGVAARFPEFEIPATTRPIAATYLSTIDESEITAHPEVADVLPKAIPFDKGSVTVEATFDGAALKALLTTDPDGSGPINIMPKNWWDGVVEILNVELTRETQASDGSWGEETIVKGMPGRAALAMSADKIVDGTALRESIKTARENATMVRRAPYYKSRFGERWLPPSERDADAEAGVGIDEATRLKREIDKEQQAIKKLEDRIAKLGQPASGGAPAGGGNPPPSPPPPPRGGAGGGKGGGKGGSGGAAPPPGGPAGSGPGGKPANPNAGVKAQLDKTLNDKKAAITRLEARLKELSGTPDTNTSATTKAAEPGLLDNPSVRVWAHDVFAERGKTYRYRLALVVGNPYFGHAAAMLADQASIAESPVLKSAPSEWTDAVTLESDRYWFITTASGPNQIGRSVSAKVEVYQFRWGYWRRGSVSAEPGDTIEAEIRSPDFSAMVALPTPGATPEGGSDDRGGKRGGGGKPTDPAPAPTPSGEPGKVGTESAKIETLLVTSSSILLGVGETQTVSKEDTSKTLSIEQVFVRDDLGQVVVRVPKDERESALYRRLMRSAERGERELEPKKAEGAGKTPPAGGRNPGGTGPDGGRTN